MPWARCQRASRAEDRLPGLLELVSLQDVLWKCLSETLLLLLKFTPLPLKQSTNKRVLFPTLEETVMNNFSGARKTKRKEALGSGCLKSLPEAARPQHREP